MSDPQLFDTTAYEVPTVDTTGMGQDAAKTARRRALLERGVHPATMLALRAGNATCGDCAHLWRKSRNSFTGWKCRQAASTGTDGPDMRKSWPACILFEPLQGTGGTDGGAA